MRRIAVVIPAAGRARRFGSAENKIWAELGGVSVLERTLAAFSTHPAVLLIVIAAGTDDLDRVQEIVSARTVSAQIVVVTGGDTRSESVRNGLAAVPDSVEIVLVHDAARPLVTAGLIDRVIEATARTGAAVPGLPLSDTVKRADALGMLRATIPRAAILDGEILTGLTAVQTPQGALLSQLRRAYAAYDFTSAEPTDEASLIEAIGGAVEIAPGDPANIKITRQEDLVFAERLLGRTSVAGQAQPYHSLEAGDLIKTTNQPVLNTQYPIHSTFPETRTGFGYDVHAFAAPAAGRKLFVGGIEIPHECGLEGHSDADVLLHAVCDALLGGLSLGDIGILFPNTDEAYRGISSLHLLAIVAERVTAAGWQTVNVDVTVAAEAPKLAPYRARMQETIADCLGVEPGRISVKATTSEKMGFVGRREGMAAWAVATVRKVIGG